MHGWTDEVVARSENGQRVSSERGMVRTVSPLDPDACYRALVARDARFDGIFFVAVKTTGIYCRPICPARTPGRDRCLFFRTAAEAETAGFRSCFRCRPELAPGAAPVDALSRAGRRGDAPHRGRGALRRDDGRRARRRAGRLRPAPPPRHAGRDRRGPPAPRRVAAAGAGAAADRRHGAADDRGRLRQRLPQRAALQRRRAGPLRPPAVGHAARRCRSRACAGETAGDR